VAVVTEATGSARAGALPVAALFLLGLALLARVRPEGDAAAP
jgi:MFS-type transporter involved in bile tolerance (Atg22 family)